MFKIYNKFFTGDIKIHFFAGDIGAFKFTPYAFYDKIDNFCEECKKKDESVLQNLILTGFKNCKSCRISKTVFPI